MKIVIAGGTGFLGTALARHLAAQSHDITILTRTASPATPASAAFRQTTWVPDGTTGAWAAALQGAGAIVNLAGESIAARRWSAEQKTRIRQSRVLATRSLVAAARETGVPTIVSGSAVGYYGDCGDETLTEASPAGHDFLASVCRDWEHEAAAANTHSRVALIRTGIVLDRRAGALQKMITPFFLGAGGPIGSGRQYMPWIHLADWVRLAAFAVCSEGARGPINATSPNPVTNAQFSKALGHAMHRPSFVPAPAFALRLALGEMAEALLLSGQRALPARATDLGFTFRFADLDAALANIFAPARSRAI